MFNCSMSLFIDCYLCPVQWLVKLRSLRAVSCRSELITNARWITLSAACTMPWCRGLGWHANVGQIELPRRRLAGHFTSPPHCASWSVWHPRHRSTAPPPAARPPVTSRGAPGPLDTARRARQFNGRRPEFLAPPPPPTTTSSRRSRRGGEWEI